MVNFILVAVLTMTAVKDLKDDIGRHKSDNQINNRVAHLLKPGANNEEDVTWQSLQVGDIILIKSNELVPADVLLLSTSDDNGLCFVETAELDGETNLKVRQCLVDTQRALRSDDSQISHFNGRIECELPNNNLNRFEGRLLWQDKTYSLNNDNILLRGCVLRNTDWVHGIVVFAGKDTKLMKNGGETVAKKTRIDEMANKLVLCVFGFVFLLMLIAAVNCFFWESKIGMLFNIYSFWHPVVRNKPIIIAVLNMFSFLILIQTIVPISLYVSIELIRVVLSRTYINNDLDMYYEPLDTPACARTSTLNEELGQIEYIFSDKTGTLTQNVMTFNKCSINGQLYGDPTPPKSNQLQVIEKVAPVNFASTNPEWYESSFKFYDWHLLEEIENGNEQVHEFFRLLALCHTVMADYDENGKLTYKAQSPDEAALVSAARNFGFVYKKRSPDTITVEILGVERTLHLLCVLDFDNVRKRMSVIVEYDGKRQLLCKGADTLVLQLLESGSNNDMVEQTKVHLNEYAVYGLRTLCLAVRDIDDDYWNEWQLKYHEATTSLEDREQKVSACYEEIEQNLRLIGATAVEDKLQVGVPETIYNLAKAGIKIWVLTGDKQETAINIGYSCSMLNDEMQELVIDAEDEDAVRHQLESSKQKITDGKFGKDELALIVNGHSLMHALKKELEQMFLDIACQCKTVICCRVTPLQKALVVALVKRSKQTVTLAIGDGANDVNMIKTAHIGVGISGHEGMQAVLNSDFSLAQFRYLQKLLLVHGRWAYLRIAIFLRYFFYKNFSFTMCQFWFGIYSGWSAMNMYDPWMILSYNIFYTATPIVVYGWFQQDVNAYYSQTYPQLYQPGLKNELFNLPLFLLACLEGIYDSVVVFFVIRYGFSDYNNPSGSNILTSQSAFSVATGTIVVLVVSTRCLIEMSYITFWNLFSVFGISIGLLFLLQIAFAEVLAAVGYQFDIVGVNYPVWAAPNFWLCGLVIMVLCIFPVILVRSVRQISDINLTDKVIAKQRLERKSPDDYDQLAVKRGAGHKEQPIRRSRRFGSSYAFSQQPGIGRLVETGVLRESNRSIHTDHHHHHHH